MSPEKGGGKSYDAKDDVWALGLLLAAAAAGKPLEDRQLNTTGIFALNRPAIEQLVAEAAAAASELGELVHATLSVDPARRPTARQLEHSLLPHAGSRESSSGKGSFGSGPDLLAPPPSWDHMDDPLELRLVELPAASPEYIEGVRRFRATLPPTGLRVTVLSVARVQNLPLWQSYAVHRQATLRREDVPRGAAPSRFERECLFHGTGAEAIASICRMGFNRSWTTANATAYGKGTYFARDASYSYSRQYARPDARGVQRMLLARVLVGEVQPTPGRSDQFVPDLRPGTSVRYDSTVGLLGKDTLADPSIYVTYHDGQAYPEYLIRFTSR